MSDHKAKIKRVRRSRRLATLADKAYWINQLNKLERGQKHAIRTEEKALRKVKQSRQPT